MDTLKSLLDQTSVHGLTYTVVTPSTSTVPLPSLPSLCTAPTSAAADVLFLLNFSGAQRSALLTARSTRVLLYTPANEHFGIGPVEGMVCGLPVLACNSGGPTESVVDSPAERTGWLRRPDPEVWADALVEIAGLTIAERKRLAERAKKRAREHFGMEAMARDLEDALLKTAQMGPVPTSNLLWLILALTSGLIAGFILGMFVE